jgi:hypothetical protein
MYLMVSVLVVDAMVAYLFLASKLTTAVTPSGLFIRYFPFHFRDIPISIENVKSIQSVTYSLLGEYGGWGIRIGKGGKAYNPTGDRGVKIIYNNGSHVLIGSQRPEELEQAIKQVSGFRG